MKKMFLMLMLVASCAINAYTQTAEEWIEMAKIAEQEGRWAEAGAARSSAGHAQRENGDYAAAAKNFERAAKHFKTDGRDAQANAEHVNAADSHEQAAGKAANEGRNKEAAKHYEEAAKQWEKAGRSNMAESARARAESLPVVHQPRFHIGLIGSLPLGKVTPQNVRVESLQSAMFSPGKMEQLFEQLQGEFFIGSLSGQSAQNFEMRGTTQAMPGLRLGHRLGNRFEIRAGGHYFQTKWSGNFPVVVFPFEQHPSQPPKTLQGSLSASSSGILAEADLAYFFTKGTIRPFVHGGIRGQFPTQNESGATLAGVAIPLETAPIGSSYSAVGGAGIRVGFLKNGFLDANASYAKVPGGGYAPSVVLSAGWRFGGVAAPTLVHDNKAPAEPKECACWLVSLDYYGQTGTGLEAPKPDAVGDSEKNLKKEIDEAKSKKIKPTVKIPWKGKCSDKYVVKVVAACENADCIDIKWEKEVGDEGKKLGQIKRTSKGKETYYGTSECDNPETPAIEGETENSLKEKGYKPVDPSKAFGHASTFVPCESTFMFAICAHTPDNPLSATLVYKCHKDQIEREMLLCSLTLDTTWEKEKEEAYQEYAKKQTPGKSVEDEEGKEDFKKRYDSEEEKKQKVKEPEKK